MTDILLQAMVLALITPVCNINRHAENTDLRKMSHRKRHPFLARDAGTGAVIISLPVRCHDGDHLATRVFAVMEGGKGSCPGQIGWPWLPRGEITPRFRVLIV